MANTEPHHRRIYPTTAGVIISVERLKVELHHPPWRFRQGNKQMLPLIPINNKRNNKLAK